MKPDINNCRYFRKKACLLFVIITCLSIPYAKSQAGCTDPQAVNFDASATLNDGSCNYPLTTYYPPLVSNLPAFMEEASGLEFFNEQLWIQQDGGDGSVVYTLDTTTAAVLQTYPLPTLMNMDWEDVAEDSASFYIGDFGNNAGSRTDLRIYKINKNDLLAGTATAETIDFNYSDQTDFTPANLATHHDCEAFFVNGDSLHLFTKDWLDLKTRHYVLPNSPGSFTAQLRDSLEVGGLVTGADISEDGKALLLCYNLNTAEVFMWLLFDFPGNRFFAGNKRKISLGNPINIGKAEGIAFRNNTEGYICSERYSVIPQRLNKFDIKTWVQNLGSASVSKDKTNGPRISPNPFSEVLSIDFQGFVGSDTQLSLLSTDGKIWYAGHFQNENLTIDTKPIPPGIYFLQLQNHEGVLSRKLVKQ